MAAEGRHQAALLSQEPAWPQLGTTMPPSTEHTACGQNCPEPKLGCKSRTPRALDAAMGPLWGWGARSTPVPLETSALQGLLPALGRSVSPCVPGSHVPLSRGAHQLHVAEAVLGKEGLMNNDPSAQAEPRGQQRVAHHSIPGTHSLPSPPFPPLLRAQHRPVGQRGAVGAHRAGHQPVGRGKRETELTVLPGGPGGP